MTRKWTSGQKKILCYERLDAIKEEGVHIHANRVLQHVRAQISKSIAELNIAVALSLPLDDDMRRAMMLEEVDRARMAWGLKVVPHDD